MNMSMHVCDILVRMTGIKSDKMRKRRKVNRHVSL